MKGKFMKVNFSHNESMPIWVHDFNCMWSVHIWIHISTYSLILHRFHSIFYFVPPRYSPPIDIQSFSFLVQSLKAFSYFFRHIMSITEQRCLLWTNFSLGHIILAWKHKEGTKGNVRWIGKVRENKDFILHNPFPNDKF